MQDTVSCIRPLPMPGPRRPRQKLQRRLPVAGQGVGLTPGAGLKGQQAAEFDALGFGHQAQPQLRVQLSKLFNLFGLDSIMDTKSRIGAIRKTNPIFWWRQHRADPSPPRRISR